MKNFKKFIYFIFIIFLFNFIYLFNLYYIDIKNKNDVSIGNINNIKQLIQNKKEKLLDLKEKNNIQDKYIDNMNNYIDTLDKRYKEYEK